jgi:hypothetical protein
VLRVRFLILTTSPSKIRNARRRPRARTPSRPPWQQKRRQSSPRPRDCDQVIFSTYQSSPLLIRLTNLIFSHNTLEILSVALDAVPNTPVRFDREGRNDSVDGSFAIIGAPLCVGFRCPFGWDQSCPSPSFPAHRRMPPVLHLDPVNGAASSFCPRTFPVFRLINCNRAPSGYLRLLPGCRPTLNIRRDRAIGQRSWPQRSRSAIT